MTESKKPWLEPELIVLVRNKPEEAVLGACKNFPFDSSGPSDENSQCKYVESSCIDCNVQGLS